MKLGFFYLKSKFSDKKWCGGGLISFTTLSLNGSDNNFI